VVHVTLLSGAVLPSGASVGERRATIGDAPSTELVEPLFGVAEARAAR